MRILRSKTLTAMAMLLVAVIVLAACGGNDGNSSAVSPVDEQTATEPDTAEATVAPTSTSDADGVGSPLPQADSSSSQTEPATSVLAESAVLENVTPDQQAILDIWNSQMEAVKNREWDQLHDHCYPGYEFVDTRTTAEIEDQFVEFLEVFWALSLEDAVFANPKVTILYGTQAILEYEVHRVNGRAPFHEGAQYSLLEDGNWYDDCELGGLKSLRLQPAAAERVKGEIVDTSESIRNPSDVSNLTVRSLPSGLDPELVTEQPSQERVIELWTEFLTDSYIDTTGLGDFHHFCQNGVIAQANAGVASELLTETPDAWFIEAPSSAVRADSWEAALRLVPIVHPEMAMTTSIELGIDNDMATGTLRGLPEPMLVYESDYCEQLNTVEAGADTDSKEVFATDVVNRAMQVLENEFEAIRTADTELFIQGCHPEPVFKAGGQKAVIAALEANWPPEGRDVDAQNITLVNEQPEFVILKYDLFENGEFVEEKHARLIVHDDNVDSSSPECGSTLE